jgi:hypothetical protein
MATIARTEEMFTRTTESAPTSHRGWDAFVRFTARLLTPSWVIDYAEELAEEYSPRDL